MSDKRRKQRQLFDCSLEISWQDLQTGSRTLTVRAIDLSNSGIRVESNEPIELRTEVYVRAERYGLSGCTSVRHCGHRGAKYVLGLEFNPDSVAGDAGADEPFVDYYELLQISQNAEPETIHRVFRIMAARYHPDNQETGNNDQFLLLTKAYTVLSDPDRRAGYDERHKARRAQPLPVFGLKEFAEGLQGEVNRRLGILSLLYNRRRSNPDTPGISVLELETVMSFPREHLEFAIWFLREQQYIRPGDHSDYVISASGVEYLEAEVPSNGILSKLLHASQAPNTTAGTSESENTLALVRTR